MGEPTPPVGLSRGKPTETVMDRGSKTLAPTYLTHSLRLNPNSDHNPDNYKDLELDFSPLVFSSLERYLPPNLLLQTRDVKVNYMREILRRYYPESERIRGLNTELYQLHAANFFVPSFIKAISDTSEQGLRNIISEPSRGVFTFEMLQPRFCEMLMAEALMWMTRKSP